MIVRLIRQIPYIQKMHNAFLATLTNDLLKQERESYEAKLQKVNLDHKDEIEKNRKAFEYEISYYKNEIDKTLKMRDDQIAQERKMRDRQIAQERRKVDQELNKAEVAMKNSQQAEDRFVQSTLKFQELLYKVKKINESIQQLTVTEHGLEKLIYEIENPNKDEQEKLDKLRDKEIALKKIEKEIKKGE